jgi:hypothetical protein
LDEVNEVTEEMQGVSSTSMVSLYQNLGHPRALFTPASEIQPHLNQVEQIWHNPDPDQMAETLKVAMMTQNSFDPLHIRFNSCILHVLEAYDHMQETLIEKDREIRDRQQSHENDIQEFRRQRLRWLEKEDEYKSDRKRLEVMLATGARGLELVTLVRSKSTLNQSTGLGATQTKELEKERDFGHLAIDEGPFFLVMRA